ncbi:MAG: SUMF1/EgtB/PvdO family nonheme iron enzyme [Blastocatellia bacterium]
MVFSDKSGYLRFISQMLISFCALLVISFSAYSQQGGRTYTGDNKIKTPPATKPATKPNPKPKSNNPKPKPTVDKPIEKFTAPTNLKVPELVLIKSGGFMMGSKSSRADEQPMHNVELGEFEISKYEITNKEFEIFASSTNYITQPELEKSPISWRDYFTPDRENYPVVLVSWQDAMAYCKWLSAVTGKTYRLPTEAEWEYAAHGGTTKAYSWGDEIDPEQANYDSNAERGLIAGVVLDYIEPVDSYSANGYGLHNVSGNVAEWCYDWFDADYYKNSPSKNPIGPEKGFYKAIRGGSWVSSADICRISRRSNNSSNFTAPYLGFRIVKVN